MQTLGIPKRTIARRSFVQTKLQKFYSDAQTLLHKRITADEFSGWANEDGVFAHTVLEWVKTNMGDAAVSKLLDMNGNTYDFAGFAVSPIHEDALNWLNEDALNWLNKASQNLVILMRDPFWDSFAPVVSNECR